MFKFNFAKFNKTPNLVLETATLTECIYFSLICNLWFVFQKYLQPKTFESFE